MEQEFALVYRLVHDADGREVSPSRLWATADAISAMGNSRPLYATERQVSRRDLDAAGFFHEHGYAFLLAANPPAGDGEESAG